jgi:hypothetical protein
VSHPWLKILSLHEDFDGLYHGRNTDFIYVKSVLIRGDNIWWPAANDLERLLVAAYAECIGAAALP